MFDPSIISVLSRVFSSRIQGVARHIRRLFSERQAGQTPNEQPADQMERILDNTMDILRGGNIDDSWWKNILNKIHQSYISPEFLQEPELQDWLNEAGVANDLKSLAKTRIIGGRQDESVILARLAQSYSDRTGDVSNLATQTIDVVVAILSAGYVSSIPTEQRAITGIVQNLPEPIYERFDRLEEKISATFPDVVSQQTHTDIAKQELSKICTLRVFNPSDLQQDIQQLIQRIKNGDLSKTHSSVKAEIFFWGARLCAQDNQTITLVQRFCDELKQIEPDMDVSIVDALLLATKGEVDKALRILRDGEDADSRTVIFSILVRSRGEQHALTWYDNQEDKDNKIFFTAAGWWNLVVTLSKLGKWKEAADRLLLLETLGSDTPALAFIEGVINSAMLLPEEFRDITFTTVPVYRGITSISGEEVRHYHARALNCFKDCVEGLKKIAGSELVQFINDWYLWVRLMSPDNSAMTVARQELQQDMEDSKRAVSLMPFAWAFNIHFNEEPLQKHLAKRKLFGGLNEREQLAEFLLLEQSMEPRELINYLQQYRDRLAEVISPDYITIWWIEALVQDDQTEKARLFLEEQAVSLGDDVSNRLTVLIDSHDGVDPRPQLETLYKQSGKLIDLKNLISHLKDVDDKEALLPLLKELFVREKNVTNAHNYVACLSNSPHINSGELITFLVAHPDIVEQSNDLISARAWALFQSGEYQKAKEINDSLLVQRIHENDLALDINITVASGEWERFSSIVDREWQRRIKHTPEKLMVLAQLASHEDQNINRGLQLCQLASEKAPDNPHILIAAYMLCFYTGNEEEADPNWLSHASKLSSENKGPVMSVDLRYLVNEWGSERQDYLRVIEKRLLDGDIPIGMAAREFNIPLISFFIQASRHNVNELDGRRRTVLPTIAGGHHPIELQENWTIGLDISSIIILSYLGLLKKAIDSFHHVKLAPETMGLLFHEKNQVRFHQPSRIKAAEEIRNLVNQNQLKPTKVQSLYNQAIADEVGPNLAELLQEARENNGRVICALPLHKVGSYLEKEANLGEYSNLVISICDFCVLLHSEGKIDSYNYGHTSSFLRFRNQAKRTNPPSSLLQHPIYINSLALSYMHDSGLLQSSTACGLDLRIHPSVLIENNALIEAGQHAAGFIARIEEIRMTLRNAVESGTATFLPQIPGHEEQEGDQIIQLQTIYSLIENSTSYDALCIDDRFINRYPVVAGSTEQTTPTLCVLDILHYLVNRQIITITSNWTHRHQLRQGGYVLIPIEAEELEYWLKKASFDDNGIKESVELRIIRQTITRIASLGMLDAKNEIGFIINLASTCELAIRNLWKDDAVNTTQTSELSDWIWHHLMTSIYAFRYPGQKVDAVWIRSIMIMKICQLFTPLIGLSAERRIHYSNWIESTIFDPLRPANADLIEDVIEVIVDVVKKTEQHQENYGPSFLQCIPQSLYKIIWAREPELMSRLGQTMEEVINFGSDRQFFIRDLYEIAKDAFLEKQEIVNIEDIEKREASITVDKENGQIVFKWTNVDSQPVQLRMPELTLLSPNGDIRVTTLREMIDQFGPTSSDFSSLLHETEKRELNYDEFLSLFDEVTNGVAAAQSRVIRKINRREGIKIEDIVPQSLSYFEKLAGPLPINHEPETYFHEVLVPYRNSLLQRDFQRGLDICLLGVLRDELMPGEWLQAIDNDALWNALSSCHVESNPYSLLGALDIALYRQNDERFQEFAEHAVIKLTNHKLGETDSVDIYALLSILVDLILNRINLIENGACQPGYWKRMCSWMQAGLIARAMTKINFECGLDSFRKWAENNITMSGVYRLLIDARREPLIWLRDTHAENLYGEIMHRLISLKLRHEEAGRTVPNADKIDLAVKRIQERGIPFGIGPLEGHIQPSQSLPNEISKIIHERCEKGLGYIPWSMLSVVSQFFMLGETEQGYVQKAIEMMAIDKDSSKHNEVLENLSWSSVIAATSRDTELADKIADKVVDLSQYVSEEQEISVLIMVIIQASASFTNDAAWYEWTEERLARLANSIQTGFPCQVFLETCENINIILPLNDSIHLRARALASAGYA